MQEIVIVNVILFICGGGAYLAYVVYHHTDKPHQELPRRGILQVTRDANINARKGRILRGGIIQTVGRTKVVRGKERILVRYYGQDNGPREAENGTEFWVCAEMLVKYTDILVGAVGNKGAPRHIPALPTAAPSAGTAAPAPKEKKAAPKTAPTAEAKPDSEPELAIYEELQSWRH